MILVDAGPLTALVDGDDQHHAACVATVRRITEPLGTVWPALTEAMHLLRDVPNGHDTLWELVARERPRILSLDSADVPRMRELMRKYADLPMDVADAALIRMAEREGIHTIFTVDRTDFAVYRLHGRERVKILP